MTLDQDDNEYNAGEDDEETSIRMELSLFDDLILK